jgi:hypothetical protein
MKDATQLFVGNQDVTWFNMLNGMSPSMFVDRKTWFDMNGQFGQ